VITGIIVALAQELSTLKTVPDALWEPSLARGKFVFLTESILLIHAGAGAENACHAAEKLISKGAMQLMSWGCAAALSPELKMGDLVLAESVCHIDGRQLSVNAQWHEHVKRCLGRRVTAGRGALLQSAQMVTRKEEKQLLHQNTGAIALDMESFSIAQVAQHYAIPFLAVRSISDPASMDLPEVVMRSLTVEGEVDVPKMMFSVVRQPKEIPHLIQLGQYFQVAKRTLSDVAKVLPSMMTFDS
jgi:adenosylhomocysteine nucleosidase